jgi:hypothetical protein
MYNETSVQEFRGSLRGVLFEPQDKGYDDARKVYNGMIDKHPRIIVTGSRLAWMCLCI